MFNMVYDIQIGDYKLGLLESVEIHKSVDLLADTAVVVVPGVVYNQSLDLEGKVSVGDKVVIKLGYDDDLATEFEGYLQRIDTDDSSLTFNCEDGIYLMRKPVKEKEFKNVSIKEIAQYLVSELGMELNCSMKTTAQYEKFVIPKNVTAFDVLKKIQDENKVNIYMKGNVLNVHHAYLEKTGSVEYDFAKNIESSDLKYRRKEDRPYEVVVESIGLDGKKKSIVIGTPGGQKRTITVNTPQNEEMMRAAAENEMKYLSFDGYEGTITGWLVPYVEPTYSAHIHDKEYEYKTGSYYVVSVTTTFSEDGGVRKVELGRKLTGNG